MWARLVGKFSFSHGRYLHISESGGCKTVTAPFWKRKQCRLFFTLCPCFYSPVIDSACRLELTSDARGGTAPTALAINLSPAVCHSVGPAGCRLWSSQDDAVALEEALSAPIRLWRRKIRLLLSLLRHRAECPPQPGVPMVTVVEFRVEATPLWFSDHIDKRQTVQPARRSAGSCLLCISRCAPSLDEPARTGGISHLPEIFARRQISMVPVWFWQLFLKYKWHFGIQRLLPVMRPGVWLSPLMVRQQQFSLWDVTRLSDVNFNELSEEHIQQTLFPPVVSVIGV